MSAPSLSLPSASAGIDAPLTSFAFTQTLDPTGPLPRTIAVHNPATGEQICELDVPSSEDIANIVQRARAAQKAWAARSLDERKSILHKFGDSIAAHAEKLAMQVTVETGRPIGFSKSVISIIPDRIKFFLARSEVAFKVDEPPSIFPVFQLKCIWEPRGVIAHISAWNFPILMGCDFLVPALVCGNAVLYKPSEFCPLSARLMCQLLYEAGVPEDVCPCLIGDGRVGHELLNHPLDGVSFIGSHATGLKIAAHCGSRLMDLNLEMGGKDGFVVLEDADIPSTAALLAEGAMEHSGQACSSVDRVYVKDAIYEQFMSALVEAVKALPEGDPLDEKTRIGPITRPMHIAYLESQIADAVSKGAAVALGGSRDSTRPGSFFHPTILANVDHSMNVMTQENFGPIVGVYRLPADCTDEDAVKLVNQCKFGLTGGVFTSDRARAEKLLPLFETGTAYWNVTGAVEPAMPWGGRKFSGVGYILGMDLRKQFLRPKSLYYFSPPTDPAASQ